MIRRAVYTMGLYLLAWLSALFMLVDGFGWLGVTLAGVFGFVCPDMGEEGGQA